MKRYLKIFIFLFCSALLNNVARAQQYPFMEFGIFGGFSNYQGDLSSGLGNMDFWKNAGGVLGKYHFDRTVKLRLGVNYGRVTADDAVSENYWRRNRNLNFRSNILDVHVVSEIHLFTDPIYNQGFHPYVYGGIAGFRFNPQARMGNNEWVDLQPLGTEGQETNYLENRSKYSLTQIAIPAGVGIEINLGSNYYLSLDFGFRWTLTDFLDDVSGYYPDPNEMEISYGENSINQELADRRLEKENYSAEEGFYRFQFRGDPSNKDRYVFFGVNLTKKFTGILCNSF